MMEFDAGRRLDMEIARRVLGWRYSEDHAAGQDVLISPAGVTAYCPGATWDWGPELPAYSADLPAALTVFLTAAANYDPPLASILWAGDRWVVDCGRGQRWQGWARGKYALPLAICRAALAEQEGQV